MICLCLWDFFVVLSTINTWNKLTDRPESCRSESSPDSPFHPCCIFTRSHDLQLHVFNSKDHWCPRQRWGRSNVCSLPEAAGGWRHERTKTSTSLNECRTTCEQVRSFNLAHCLLDTGHMRSNRVIAQLHSTQNEKSLSVFSRDVLK